MLVGTRQRQAAGPRALAPVEARESVESEDEGVAGGQAALHLVQLLEEAPVGQDPVLPGRLVADARRAVAEPTDVVGPELLVARPARRNTLEAVADLRTGVRLDAASHLP